MVIVNNMWEYVDKNKIKKILKQISGNMEDFEGNLVPTVAIKGTKGHIWCYHVNERKFVKIHRGVVGYVLSKERDEKGRLLIYTEKSQIVAIYEEDLVEVGFN
jgi:hypothetical protein